METEVGLRSAENMDIYCGQLGMVIDVSYCMTVNQGMPCRNTVGCWEERVEIRALLKALCSEEELRETFLGSPTSRIGRILAAVTKMRKEGQDVVR
jgi:hypothetical protein